MGSESELAEAGFSLAGLYPDFLLATVFFTALCYIGLGHRFARRSAAVASLAIGLALATGLIWWEAEHGYSIRNLGTVAVGFAILLLAAVMYRVLSEIGGKFAGMALTLGASVLIGWVLGFQLPLDAQVLQTVTTVALIVGILALVGHQDHHGHRFPQTPVIIPTVRNDLSRLHRDRHLAGTLAHTLRRARREADFLDERPELESDLMLQLRRILPVEGYLTDRLATLREKAYRISKGQVARINELETVASKLPPEAKRRLSEELIVRFKELKLDLRLERLDRAGAENERRIRQITQETQAALARHDHREVAKLLKTAEKLQVHNARLFKIISRTEAKLISAAKHVAGQNMGVDGSDS